MNIQFLFIIFIIFWVFVLVRLSGKDKGFEETDKTEVTAIRQSEGFQTGEEYHRTDAHIVADSIRAGLGLESDQAIISVEERKVYNEEKIKQGVYR